MAGVFPISDYFTCKGTKFSNQKAETGKMNEDVIKLHAMYQRLTDLKTNRLKGWKKIFYANNNEKGATVAILIPDKISLK